MAQTKWLEVYGALCAYIRSNVFCRWRWHTFRFYAYNTGILILCDYPYEIKKLKYIDPRFVKNRILHPIMQNILALDHFWWKFLDIPFTYQLRISWNDQLIRQFPSYLWGKNMILLGWFYLAIVVLKIFQFSCPGGRIHVRLKRQYLMNI